MLARRSGLGKVDIGLIGKVGAKIVQERKFPANSTRVQPLLPILAPQLWSTSSKLRLEAQSPGCLRATDGKAAGEDELSPL